MGPWERGRKREGGRTPAGWVLTRTGWAESTLSATLSAGFPFSIGVRLTCLWQEDDALGRPALGETIKRLFNFLQRWLGVGCLLQPMAGCPQSRTSTSSSSQAQPVSFKGLMDPGIGESPWSQGSHPGYLSSTPGASPPG